MGKPAARIGDMHTCPMVTPGTPPVPHVGGPILGPGCPTVLIGGMPASVMGDNCVCVGPPDMIVLGSTGVFIGNKPAARMGDQCAHGGAITVGCPTVLIGETMAGGGGGIAANPVNVILDLMGTMPVAIRNKMGMIAGLKEATENGDKYAVQKTIPVRQKDPPQKIEKDCLAFTLQDEDGTPIAGEKYEVTLPSGSILKGVTDKQGKVKISGIEAGNCKVSFPDLHMDDWS